MGKLEDIMLKTERGNPVREIASLDKKKKIWGGGGVSLSSAAVC